MKAEIGFVFDNDQCRQTDQMKLVITAQTRTEATALRLFAERAGLQFDEMSSEVEVLAKETLAP